MKPLRALHVFPIFGWELSGGSDLYQYMTSRKLVERGVAVDVFATRAERFRQTSPVTLDWRNDLPAGHEARDGIDIYRFPATWSVPTRLGHFVSRFAVRRWQEEESRFTAMTGGSQALLDHHIQCARSRPTIYDWIQLLGLGPWPLSMLRRIERSIESYDVILVGFVPFALVWSVTRLARRLKKPVAILALFHPEDRYHHHRPFYRALATADAVLCQTSYSTDLIRSTFPGARPYEIGCGTDTLATAHEANGDRFRGKHGLGQRPLVLMVARKEPGKRHDLAVRAMEMLEDKDACLVMIGEDVDRKPITSRRVLYLGRVPHQELQDAFAACDVFLLPSEHESFGIVFLEAWAHRKPVIGNRRCQPVASVIQDGVDGFLCSTPEEIAARLTELLEQPSRRLEMGEAGRRKVQERYTWETIAGKVEAVYDRMVADGPRVDY